MGIKGLLSYCRQHLPECTDTVDLVEISRQQDGIVLLADFYSFEHLIMEHFWAGLSRLRQNPYLKFAGGEYLSINAYVSKLVNDLKSLGINLKFFVDGSKGSSIEATRQKLETWRRRHMQELQKQREIMDMLGGFHSVLELSREARMRPVLLEIQFMQTLQACGCQVHVVSSGEADYVIAEELRSNPKAFAVISNDTDFCVFEGGAFICNENFDIHGDLQLGQPNTVPEKPLRIVCHVIRNEKITTRLNFADSSQLVELSILAGNDFTAPFMQARLYEDLGIDRRHTIQQLAAFIRANGRVENNQVFSHNVHKNRDFESAVQHSRQFYMLTLPQEDKSRRGYVHNLLCDGIEDGSFPPHVMGMHNGFYWRRMLLEEVGHRCPSSEVAMIDLRTFIYRMLLPKHKNQVTEHGRTETQEYMYIRISASQHTAPPINVIKREEIFKNLRHFDRIMSHFEPQAFNKTWFDRYGRKSGFICYVLRYFLVLNWGHNLNISENEFLALVAVVFGRVDENWYQTVAIRPFPRCVTIGNWFQNIYRHAYTFLGKLLYLTHEFPTPGEIFSGSVWTAFYTCSSEDAWNAGVMQVPRDMLIWCQRDMDAVIKERRHMLRYLTENIFYFDDRY